MQNALNELCLGISVIHYMKAHCFVAKFDWFDHNFNLNKSIIDLSNYSSMGLILNVFVS
jgi:hypothetical protein